ncbi:deoxyribonuclease-1-like [Mizuhopecten yessoensis]|uniref:Deoxyribonuclease n=1 Tax=Mizuhopecten yessoensis TaxID=6573 RepID=A0A210QAC5_MIZYE|nr:deoxyribonuclease-1-like [Mizuhopecten yessoensis]OWF45687.1 Deoxyribonuclease-1 [Mizuhopecten yessoensis]
MGFRMITTLLISFLVVCACTAATLKSAHAQRKLRTDGFLSVSAFNIKTFGKAKMSNAEVAETIKNIVLEYDLILIQEIRDASGESFALLLDMVNSVEPYGMTISERLGRSSYKEQYAYFYRKSALTLLETRLFPDPGDEFEREPYSALFQSTFSSQSFVVMGLHAKPDDAVREIELMEAAYEDALNTLNNPNMIIMGDFNADCSYAKESELAPFSFYYDSTFDWLTPWDADTTTSRNTDCAYDRIVVTGSLKDDIISSSVYHFEETYHLNDDEMKAVSDHYPVDVFLVV